MGSPSAACAAEISAVQARSSQLPDNMCAVSATKTETESLKDLSLGSPLNTCAEVSGKDGKQVEELDENIWKNLMEELWTPILAGLPLQSIFRMRSVCKRWNSLLHDAKFFDMCSQIRTQAPFCIRQADEGYAAYDPASNSWRFWPYSFVLSNYSLSMSSTSSVPFWESGAAGGLLLLEGYGQHERVLHLANPINKTQKQLPLVRELKDSFTSAIVGMVVDKDSGSYKVLAVDHGVPEEVYLYEYYGGLEDEEEAEETFKFFVYDSESNSWETCGKWQRGVKQFFQRPAFHNGSLYCLTSDLEAFHLSDAPPIFHVFCVDRDSWYELPAQVPSPMTFAHLFEMQGRLMLTGGVANRKGLLSVHVWQLDEANKNWEEVMTMPKDLVKALSVPTEPHFRSHFNCVATGNYMCVTGFSRKLSICNTVMCNLSTNYWWLLPTYSKKSYSGTFLLEPRLDVVL